MISLLKIAYILILEHVDAGVDKKRKSNQMCAPFSANVDVSSLILLCARVPLLHMWAVGWALVCYLVSFCLRTKCVR